MTSTVWIINHYAAIVDKDGWDGRHQSLARALLAHGWQPVLFMASTGHPVGDQHLPPGVRREIRVSDRVVQVLLRARPYRGSGVHRVLNMLGFTIRLLDPRHTRDLPTPDVIVGSTVHPLAAWAARSLARRHRVPFVFEIRDVWPDALVHLGRIKPDSLTARSMRRLMRSLVRGAQLVVSPLPGVGDYVRSLGEDRPFLWVSNGADSADLDATGPQQPADSSGAGTGAFTFMYLGSYGSAMDIETILQGFSQLLARTPDQPCRLRLVGSGTREAELRAFADALGVASQVSFEPRIPRKDVNTRAREADCLVHALHDHRVYAFGISPNKIFDYLLAGRPVIFAARALNNPVAEAGAGVVVAPENPDALASAMLDMVRAEASERSAMGERGRRHVVENYTYEALAARLAVELNGVRLGEIK